MPKLTHIDPEGRVRMVDVTDKPPTSRTAAAQGVVSMSPATFTMIQKQTVEKGNVLETARIAGIMAAKKTPCVIRSTLRTLRSISIRTKKQVP